MTARYHYDYPRPALTADVVALRPSISQSDTATEVLLIQRAHPPHAGQWALPGGFVEPGESPREAAIRELREETHLVADNLVQIGAYGNPGRDPRGGVVTVAFVAWLRIGDQPVGDDDAADARWWPTDRLPPLAFDHADILAAALAKPDKPPS